MWYVSKCIKLYSAKPYCYFIFAFKILMLFSSSHLKVMLCNVLIACFDKSLIIFHLTHSRIVRKFIIDHS